MNHKDYVKQQLKNPKFALWYYLFKIKYNMRFVLRPLCWFVGHSYWAIHRDSFLVKEECERCGKTKYYIEDN